MQVMEAGEADKGSFAIIQTNDDKDLHVRQ